MTSRRTYSRRLFRQRPPLEHWDGSFSEEFESQPLRESEDEMVIPTEYTFDWFKAVYRDWVFGVCRGSAPDLSPLVCVDRRVRRQLNRRVRRRLQSGATRGMPGWGIGRQGLALVGTLLIVLVWSQPEAWFKAVYRDWVFGVCRGST